ncbi:MAG: aminoacyl-tRNA hydrolase [Saprospiraceae bacterium]|nr:aminoacyl-tRNA hydrolase [Saprospiraceae bacterium]
MKYLIAGLGNMDKDYFGTRHNIGFDVVDEMATKLQASFSTGSLAHFAQSSYKGRKLILIKPTTYMNLSGKAIKYWMTKENITLDHLFVILDDLNLPYGKIRIRPNGSDGGHNGLKDIQQNLESNQYARLRVGIGNTFSKGKQVDFVLGKWNQDELKHFDKIKTLAAEASLSFCFAGLQNTMNIFNAKSIEEL